MTNKHILEALNVLQAALCLGLFWTMIRRRVNVIFPALFAFVLDIAFGDATRSALIFHARALHIPRNLVLPLLFLFGWIAQIAGLCLLVLVIYGLFSEAMRPFPGLHRIGKVVFRWVGVVSFVFALALSVTPELFVRGVSISGLYDEVHPRFDQGIHVLILCLLIFVCFAIRPLGLTFRSHLFGVVLGLGVYATIQLVQQAWYATTEGQSVYSAVYIFDSAGTCFAIAIWLIYFALPEPERRLILLPTTSPFFHWNRISEILGDSPGNVAVAGFTPDMLAPAEIEMLTMAISREEEMARSEELSLPDRRALADLPAPTESFFALSR